MTEEKIEKMVEETHEEYGDVYDLGKGEIRNYYYSNWGCGKIVHITMDCDGSREIEFADGTIYNDEVEHACYEYRRRW